LLAIPLHAYLLFRSIRSTLFFMLHVPEATLLKRINT